MPSLKNLLESSIDDAIKKVREKMAAEDFSASGKTEGSLLRFTREDKNYITSGISAFLPITWAEKGRPPFKMDQGLIDDIYNWMPLRGIKQDKGVAFLIARKISKFGTKRYRDKAYRDIYSNTFTETIEEVENKIVNLVSETINTEVNKAYAPSATTP
jgi:hypothetical protein